MSGRRRGARASLLPRLRARLGPDVVATACLLIVAPAVGTLAAAQSLVLAYPVMVALGFASIGTISSFMIAAQSVLPDWIRGRGVAVLGLLFQAASRWEPQPGAQLLSVSG
jgi:Transmembrane secretion effector